MTTWKLEEKQRNVHYIRSLIPTVEDELYVLLLSDVHWDNPHCDRKLLKRHLDQALKRNAVILVNGDFFCCMQGKYDRRSSKSDIRPEHQSGEYLDSLVNTAAEYLEPYKNNLCVLGMGNHESSIRNRLETDLLERLADKLRAMGGITRSGGYSGYVKFFHRRFQGNANEQSFILHYFHGAGGGGPVTRGVIQTNRMAVYLCDADIVWTGHTHDSWQVPIQRVRLNLTGKVELTRQVHVRTAGYKEEYASANGMGWHIETGKAPKPLGGAWLRIFRTSKFELDYEITEAK